MVMTDVRIGLFGEGLARAGELGAGFVDEQSHHHRLEHIRSNRCHVCGCTVVIVAVGLGGHEHGSNDERKVVFGDFAFVNKIEDIVAHRAERIFLRSGVIFGIERGLAVGNFVLGEKFIFFRLENHQDVWRRRDVVVVGDFFGGDFVGERVEHAKTGADVLFVWRLLKNEKTGGDT